MTLKDFNFNFKPKASIPIKEQLLSKPQVTKNENLNASIPIKEQLL